MTTKTNVAIFVSGKGSNALKIIQHFKSSSCVKIGLVLSNNEGALALEKARNLGVETVVFDNQSLIKKSFVLNFLIHKKIQFIVLAGFLRQIPAELVQYYATKMVNIHPSLLPKSGGTGMFGMRVHEAVIKNQEKESGITIHYVSELYDKGAIIFQKKISVEKEDNSNTLAKKVQCLEHHYFPITLQKLLCNDV